MLIKTSELSGAALDWAVAQVGAYQVDWCSHAKCLWFESNDHEWLVWSPSANWAQGGPLIDMFDVWLSNDDDTHCASTHPHVNEYIRTGPTKLIAACRAIVAAKLGDEVEVPDELLSAPL